MLLHTPSGPVGLHIQVQNGRNLEDSWAGLKQFPVASRLFLVFQAKGNMRCAWREYQTIAQQALWWSTGGPCLGCLVFAND